MENTDAFWAGVAVVAKKKRDGFMVMKGPLIIGFLRFHEGIIYRLTGKLPKRYAKTKATIPAGVSWEVPND